MRFHSAGLREQLREVTHFLSRICLDLPTTYGDFESNGTQLLFHSAKAIATRLKSGNPFGKPPRSPNRVRPKPSSEINPRT